MVFFAPQGKTYYNLDAESSCWRFSNEEQDPPPPFPLPDSSPSHPLSPILPLPLPFPLIFPSHLPIPFPALPPLPLPFPSTIPIKIFPKQLVQLKGPIYLF